MKLLRELSTTPTAQLGRAGRFMAFQIKLWSYCIRLLKRNRAGQQAASLSYYTIFGIVPLAIVAVLIFNSIPAYRNMGDQFKRLIYQELHLNQIEYPNPDKPDENVALTDYLDQIIDRFFDSINKGSLGLVSALLVIWAALRLLSLIEIAFNHMWYVPKGRSFIHRIINFWALLTLGPLLLAAGFYATTRFTLLKDIEAGVLASAGPFISYLLSLVGLFLLYLVMPNAKVRAGAALWGAAVAALIWGLAKWGFGIYVTELIPYSTIYGVLGLIPLGVFWVYVTWMIVLFGLQLVFAIQHFDTLEKAESRKIESRFIANDMTVIAVAREIAAAFESGRGPVSTDEICSRLDIPGEFGQRLLDELVSKGLFGRTSEPSPGYILVRDPAHIRLADVAEAVAGVAFAQPKADTHGDLFQVAQAQRHQLTLYTLQDVLDNPSAILRETPAREQSEPARETPPSEDLLP